MRKTKKLLVALLTVSLGLQGTGFCAFADDEILMDAAGEWEADDGSDGDIALTGIGSSVVVTDTEVITEEGGLDTVSDTTDGDSFDTVPTDADADLSMTLDGAATGDVVIAGLDDGILVDTSEPTEIMNEEEKEVGKEETRLLYVAMTRTIYGFYCFPVRKNYTKGRPSCWADLLPLEKDYARSF